MQFSKEHMAHQYNWAINAVTLYTGSPSRRLFDPNNGSQVLFIINCFCESIGLPALREGRQLEELIATQLPGSLKSELAVFNWLKGVYLYNAN